MSLFKMPTPHTQFAQEPEGKRISLPVVRTARTRPVPRRSWISHWRAAALIGVHLLMAGHILHWWITGKSIGRFVLSDTMQTLELGEINPGAILFATSILVTALLGRFMCGWVCHIGALQDFSTWILRKTGVRPHLFRSRLLGFVPFALALYMFLWPTFKRLVLGPALKPAFPEIAANFSSGPFPGFSFNLTTDRLWDGLPSLWVGIPFLIVCGFLTVYFLGARGLCRYACPYGGFLLPAEQLAIGRVTVDPSKCDQCGLCTAACSTGVRVHDEIRLHGSVIDRNCIRSFDCIGACPHKALSLSVGKPAIIAAHGSKSARYDLSWPEELLCLSLFVVSFFILRGLYQQLPLLMATPLAIIIAYLGWKTLCLRQRPDVTFARAQLRRSSQLTRSGHLFLGVVTLVGLLLIQSAAVRILILRAEHFDNQVNVSFDNALTQQGISTTDRNNAQISLRLYRLAGSCWRDDVRGIGFANTPEVLVRVSWLHLVLGDPHAAIAELELLRHSGQATDNTIAELALLLRRIGDSDRARSILQSVLKTKPTFSQSRELLATMQMESGRAGEAEQQYLARLAERPTDALSRAGLARVLFVTGRQPEAIAQLQEAARIAPREPTISRDFALALAALQRVDEAVTELKRCAEVRPIARLELTSLGAQILRANGREADALALEADMSR